MHQTLHPYLKRGLDFDASPVHPNDLVEEPPAKPHDAQDASAKRRRVEAVALQYLRGRTPLILTAHLKGPFNTKQWQNPWAEKQKKALGGPSNDAVRQAQAQRKTRSKAPQVPSPEASRAVAHTEEQLHSQSELEPLPATAPIPDDEEHSGGTEFFSVDTEQFVANNSPMNPFWLRRPAADISFPANSQTDKSPSRIRKRDHRYSPRKSLHLAPPREPLGGQLPIRATPPDEWRSSASASMDISSVARLATASRHHTTEQNSQHANPAKDGPDSSRLREDSAQEEEARSSQIAQYAQIEEATEAPISLLKDPTVLPPDAHIPNPLQAQSFDSLVPATTYKMPSTVQVPQSSPTHGAVGSGSHSIPSREDIQRSAESFVSSMPRSTRNPERPSTGRTIEKGSGLPKNHRHDQVASPALDSSTGFMYRRVGQPKNGIGNLPRTKPRAVNFSSSSPANKITKDNPDARVETRAFANEADMPEEPLATTATNVAEGAVVQKLGHEAREEEEEPRKDDQQESYKLRQSQYSTQAAMLLAQLEFQEDSSQLSSSSTTLRPWSQPAHNTPPPLLPQPSPAITPLSVFDARTDLSFGDLAGTSLLDGPPISTQDLFDAASPFAFSTVKKKSQRPRRTSMRFPLTNLNESVAVRSPTPLVERIPPQEKNTSTMWTCTHEKSSVDFFKPMSQSPQRTINGVELPQMDFHTSLDFGPNADFTDYFLEGLNNES